ncbi:MAG: S8 family serine peptidase [Ruminococcus sp.]|nr:S8 family serine peptidase [Ruminococcus sp.]
MKKCSWILVLIMLLDVLFPITVSAENLTEMIYRYENYTIKYDVVNCWENNQNITITILNTGSESISGWALKYDAGGKISGLWNGIVYDNNETEYIIKNAGYNFEITPNSFITFGYTLSGENLIVPAEIEICSFRVNKEDGFKVNLKKTNEWETGLQAEIEIVNLSNKPIEAWTLSFGSNFNIEELWNAKLISKNTNTYEVANKQWTTPIQPNTSVSFGFTASIDENIQPEIKNVVLTEIVIKNNTEPDSIEIFDTGIYYKEVTNEGEIVYNSDGLSYVKNQVLIMANDNISFDEMSSVVNDINADIVGYIDYLNKYQIEFKFDVSLDYLRRIINEFNHNSIVEHASLNYIFDIGEDFIPNDPITSMNGELHDEIWNLYAINVFRAWDYYNEMSMVSVGIIDNMFDTNHVDLFFEKKWEMFLNFKEYITNELTQKHGTHVAGIMAAKFDNGEGISGICPKNKLYGYAIGKRKSEAGIEAGLAKLIKEDVKVINISLNTLDNNEEFIIQAIKKGSITQTYIDDWSEAADSLNSMLKKSLDKGYDFVITVSSGNKDIDTIYNNVLNYITNAEVKNHIIVVGAIGHFDNSEYYVWNKSNYGSRVDVVAPGVEILSTTPNDSYESDGFIGTSMAAPHVSGIAGMMYSVNPNLTGDVIKQIINKSSKLRTVSDTHGFEYGIADAKLAVSTAYYYDKSEKIVFGKLEDNNDLSKIYADTELTISYIQDGMTKSQKICSDENGEFEIVIPKDINELELEIKADGYEVMEMKRLGIFWGSTSVINVKLTPIEITVKGKVEEYNLTTKVTKPIANHTVVIYSKEQPDLVIAKGITNANGEYEIKFNKQGDFIVWFSDEKQSEFYAYNGEYIFDARFDTEDDEDKEGDNDKDKDDDENEKSDIIVVDIYGDTGIDPEDIDYSGGATIIEGNLASGIKVIRKNGGYVYIYVDQDYYDEYVNPYSHIWAYTYGALMYKKYNADNQLVSSGKLYNWYTDSMYYKTTLVCKTYITIVKITKYDDFIRIDCISHKKQIYDGGLGDLLGESYDHSDYVIIK